MGETKQKIMIGLLVLAFVPAVVFLVAMFGKFPAAEKPEVPTVQETLLQEVVTEPSEVSIPTETTPEETVPETTVPAETMPEETAPETTEAPVTYDTVPLHYQNGYTDIRYNVSTLAQSGSVVASLSMVATYLTGHEYLPDEMMELFDHIGGTSMVWLETASDELQLPWTRAGNVHDALNAVRDGKIVIAVMNEKSYFSRGQHFIVLTGVNEEGLVTVNDPDENNYSAWALKDGFENGFRDGLIISGFAGAWIYDPEAMPEEPFIYEGPEPEECRYPGVELTEWEINLLAKLIWGEAQGEPYEGQQAIAEVVLNRLVSGDFQSSISDIVYADEQFASVDVLHLAKPTHVQYEAIERALYGPYILPMDVVFFATFRMNDNVWGDIGNHTFCYGWQ